MMRRDRRNNGISLSYDNVDEFVRYDNDLANGDAFQEFLYGRCRYCLRFYLSPVGGAGDRHAAAQFAVHLDHKFDLILNQCGSVRLSPGGIQDIVTISQFTPERLRDMRRDRGEQTEQDGESFCCNRLPAILCVLVQFLQHIEHLHRRRGHRVELLTIKIVDRLLERSVDLASRIGKASSQLGRHIVRYIVSERVAESPDTSEESMRALDAAIRPLQGLFRWRCEHHEEASGIGTILVDQRLWVDTVTLGFRHGAHSLKVDRFAVCQ